jgi:putative flippase GtrA
MSPLAARFDALTGGRGARLNRELRRFVKFGIVGISGFAIDFSVLNLLIFRAGMPPWQANTISFTLAVTNTFIWNRLWTCPESRQRNLVPQLAQFFLVNLLGWGINEGVFLSSHHALWSHLLGSGPAWNLSKATASGVALFWNFGANRLWTWRGL